jgi:hypothetical protein
MTENNINNKPTSMKITGLRPPREKCFTKYDAEKIMTGEYPNGMTYDEFIEMDNEETK